MKFVHSKVAHSVRINAMLYLSMWTLEGVCAS